MTQTPIIDQVTSTGADVYRVVKQLEPALVGIPRHEAIMAMLSMVIILMDPEIDEIKLARGVKEVSEFICLLVAGDRMAETKVLMN